MNKFLVLMWTVIIGTNAAAYYSRTMPYQGAIVLAGAGCFLFLFHKEILRLVFNANFLIALAILAVPILLMLLSDHSFERAAYTSQIVLSLIFVVACVLASRPELDRTLAAAAVAIVLVGVAQNLYELFLENNLWSIAPGRSAGFHVNPNISAETIVGYATVFLLARPKRLGVLDFAFVVLVLVGVFCTFSRAGMVVGLMLMTAGILARAQHRQVPRIVLSGFVALIVAFAFASFVVENIDLSPDARTRVVSLIESGGIGDYEQERGMTGLESLQIALENPVLGAGVGSLARLGDVSEGPHNTFLAVMLEYGLVGLGLYVIMILRLVRVARRGDPVLSRPVLFLMAWLVLFGFASHTMLTNPETIALLGFAVARACRVRFTSRIGTRYTVQRWGQSQHTAGL
jgi:O-antigen ligase